MYKRWSQLPSGSSSIIIIIMIIIIIDSKAPSLRPRPPGIEPSPPGLVSDTLPLSYRLTPDRVAQISGSDISNFHILSNLSGVNFPLFLEMIQSMHIYRQLWHSLEI